MMTVVDEKITQYIQNVLQRDPETDEITYWSDLIETGSSNLEDARDSIIGSQEAQENVHPIILTYQAIYGRVPDAGGLDHWTDRFVELQDLDNPLTATVDEALVEVMKSFVDPSITEEFSDRFEITHRGITS